MANIKKHVGKVKSTDKRCVIVFMQLPENQNKALIIEVESLQPRYEQILLEVVDSSEGQNENDLAAAMARRTVQETGRTVLEEFHRMGLMRTEPIDNIIMMPRPNTPFLLKDILEQLGRLTADAPITDPALTDTSVKYNPIVNNMNAAEEEKRQMMAMNFIAEAEMLESEANKKREQAYQFAPELRKSKRQITKVVESSATVGEVKAISAAIPTTVENTTTKKRGRKPKATATNG